MGEMELFFKCNKEERENREMPVCSALKDENGNIRTASLNRILERLNMQIES